MKEIFYGEIILPSDIYVASGTECNLWWSTIAVYEEGDRSIYFEVSTDTGRHTARSFIIYGTDDNIGDHKLTIRSRELRTREILDEKTVTVHITKIATGNENSNILMIGDSRTWHTVSSVQGKEYSVQNEHGDKTTTAELMKLVRESGASFTFLGTKVSGTDSTVRNFADNGRTYGSAVRELTEAGGLKHYIESDCGAGEGASLDYATIMFGINDLAEWGNAAALDQYEACEANLGKIIQNAKNLIDFIKDAYPECRIILTLENSTVGSQDGYGYWGHSDRICQVEWEFAIKALRKRIITEFDNGRYYDKVTMCTAGLWVDRIYGFPYTMEKTSARSEAEPVMRLRNGVHPHDSGYKTIADGYFGALSYLENKK